MICGSTVFDDAVASTVVNSSRQRRPMRFCGLVRNHAPSGGKG
jgi:hypothetical protein